MATTEEVKDIATAVKEICTELKRVKYKCDQLLANNSAKSIDWAAQEFPNPEALDGAGNIEGENFSPGKVSNAIGSISSFAVTLWGAGHGGNIELIVKPLP